MSRYVCDIETNNLLGYVTKIHCIALYDLDKRVGKLYVTPTEQQIALDILDDASIIVGHNWSSFDQPVLRDVLGWTPRCETYDTLLAGCILWPEEIRSLETWAKILRLKEQKVQNEDWTVYTDHMGKRCLSDVEINARIYEHILKQDHEPISIAARLLEQEVARVHAGQTVHGVHFNVVGAQALHEELSKKLENLRVAVIEESPAKCLIVGVALKNQEGAKKERTRDVAAGKIPPCTASRTAKGDITVVTRKYFPKDDELATVLGPYTRVEFRRINPDSPQEVKELLLDLGWIPTEYNTKKLPDGSYITTSPKLTEDSYDTLPEGYGKTIATYNTLKHRKNFLQNKTDLEKGAIPEAIRGGGLVSAQAFTCGTPTARYRHSGVVCNIPRVTSIYGKEFRGLFGVSDGNFQVGIDLSGIEARMLAHYLLLGNYKDARKTADLILNPDKGSDFHSFNARVWGVSRDTAKTCLYALVN